MYRFCKENNRNHPRNFQSARFLSNLVTISIIVFAASVLLLHIVKFRSLVPGSWAETNIKVVDMAVELLEAMDESVVAKRAAELIKQSWF